MPYLRDAVPDFLRYWRVVEAAPDALKLARWGPLYAAKHEPYISFYTEQFSPDLPSAFRRFGGVLSGIEEVSSGMDSMLGEIEYRLQRLFEADVGLNVFLFVGGFGPSAFVAYVGGEPWLWLACEKLCEYPGDLLKAKVCHEAVHTMHLQMLRRSHPSLKLERYERTLAYHLFSEGLAALSTKMVFPELAEPVYMLLEKGEEELEWCARNEGMLIEMVSGMLGAEDAIVRAMWFRSRHHESVPYTGTGYYVAAVSLQELLDAGQASPKWLATLHPREHLAVSLQALRSRSVRIGGR